MQTQITQEELSRAVAITGQINNYFESKVVGQSYLGYTLLISLMTNGHILLESVPGLAKTTAAKVITEAVNGNFSRIQCTPDLLPSDIMGTQTYNAATNTFETVLDTKCHAGSHAGTGSKYWRQNLFTTGSICGNCHTKSSGTGRNLSFIRSTVGPFSFKGKINLPKSGKRNGNFKPDRK